IEAHCKRIFLKNLSAKIVVNSSTFFTFVSLFCQRSPIGCPFSGGDMCRRVAIHWKKNDFL
ncbi:hypothetical protein, partial [uncultured Duncaniella sp.]